VNCRDTQLFIHGYLDGELDLVKSLEVEQHLQDCPACSQAYKNHQALRAAFSASSLYVTSPVALRKRIHSSVRRASQAAPAPLVMRWRWLGVVASLAAVVVMVWGLARSLSAPSVDDLLTQQVIASHVRSLMPNHLADVASSDQHTVKPWFNGKLDFSPWVEDLTDRGFPLVGGRLDYLDNRPVAALVYRRQQHLINLFIWPSPQASDVNAKTEMRLGYYVAHWIKSGMTYWAVSDLNESEFQEFVRLVQNQISPTPSP
jgi:anti-sigma factor RsiW